MQPLLDRVFVVTGAGGGIAGPIARALADAGARLVLVGHDLARTTGEAERLGAGALGADLTRLDETETMARAVVERHGRIDGLVHTVGGFAMGRIVDSDAATYDRMFDLNVRSLFHVIH